MGVTEASRREVEKKAYRNQTAGWVGVTKLNHLGAQEGSPVAPYGTVWLTDDEAKLTARAPAKAEDNPFVEQEFDFFNAETQQIERHQMAPLVMVEAEEGEGDDRFVPTSPILAPDAAVIQAGHAAVEAALEGHDPDERPVPTSPQEAKLAASATAAVPPSHTRPGAPGTHAPLQPEQDQGGEAESWLAEPESEQPQPGQLGGEAAPNADDGGQPTGASPAATATVESATPGAQAGEEHAAHTESGEETGAADTPAGEPAEGEFAAHEEVGSPEAPAQGQES